MGFDSNICQDRPAVQESANWSAGVITHYKSFYPAAPCGNVAALHSRK